MKADARDDVVYSNLAYIAPALVATDPVRIRGCTRRGMCLGGLAAGAVVWALGA